MELQPVLVNPTPVVHAGQRLQQRIVDWSKASQYSHRSSEDLDKIDANEVFEHIKDISDPEHPFSLEQASLFKRVFFNSCLLSFCSCAW
jgi:hypothetical protein|tara:strand:+ start:657 stop:923 length:267 start_codon:yes stop_codon:yes gene_type:complete